MVLQKIDKLIMQGDALFGTLHKVNSEILGTLIEKISDEGYTFKTVLDL